MPNNMDSSIYRINLAAKLFGKEGYEYLTRGVSNNLSEREQEVLKILKKMGFPSKESGTYFYKALIMGLLAERESLKGMPREQEKLKEVLKDSYCPFFKYLADDLGTSATVFHTCVQASYPAKKLGEKEISREIKINSKMSYLDAAWRIALHVEQKIQNSQSDKQPNCFTQATYVKK